MSAHASSAPRVTTTSLVELKRAGRPVVMITAYDHHAARLVEQAGVDVVLVGDSLGMTVLGLDSTLPVTMDDMVRHTAAVSRACKRALVVSDMPFMSFQASTRDALINAGRLLAEGGAHAVKVEGGHSDLIETVGALVRSGIPVMGHLGLTPQSVNALGGYRGQAKQAPAAAKLMSEALALQDAGAFAIVLECIPAELAERVSRLIEIPTIGIGAGAGCDGEVQVFHDLLGIGDRLPRHAKRYAQIGAAIESAVEQYAADVRDKVFPGEEQSVHADPEMIAQAELIFAGDIEEDRS